MKSLIEGSVLLLFTACIVISCTDDNASITRDSGKLLLGHWNDYENGTEQTGFTPGITSGITLVYESGISFSSEGTFNARYYDFTTGTWTEHDGSVGTYKFWNNRTIKLLFMAGTIDEHELNIQVVKLDEEHLWFKHDYFGHWEEFHLERVTK